MGVWLWIMGVIFVLFVLYFGVGWVAAITLTRVGDHPQFDQTPGSFGLNYQTVQISSRGDRFRLSAWYIPHDDARGAIILVHGRDASKQNAISGKLPKLAAQLHGAGLTVLMLDMRGHGQSEGKRYTWGVYERRDVLGAVDYLLDQGFVSGEIAALGISLGGAAVVGAAFEEPSIGALVLDSTFADLEALVRPNWRKESGIPMLFLPSVFMMWQALYRFDLRKVKPAWELAQMPPRPVLVMHSRSDETVPVEHGLQLAEVAQESGLVLFNDGEHAELFRDAPDRYFEALVQFLFEKWLGS